MELEYCKHPYEWSVWNCPFWKGRAELRAFRQRPGHSSPSWQSNTHVLARTAKLMSCSDNYSVKNAQMASRCLTTHQAHGAIRQRLKRAHLTHERREWYKIRQSRRRVVQPKPVKLERGSWLHATTETNIACPVKPWNIDPKCRETDATGIHVDRRTHFWDRTSRLQPRR